MTKAVAGPNLSEFFKLSRPRRKPCSVGFALGQLDDVEREQLIAALATDNGIITAAAIQQWLGHRDHTTTASAVTSHRKRVCSCDDA